jgi:uncharacterized protein (TIGR03435 family)
MKLSEDQIPPNMERRPVLIFADSMPLTRGAIKIIRNMQPGGLTMTLSGSAVPISLLADVLQNSSDRRIFDKTELKGLFDFDLHFAAERQPPGAITPEQPQGVAPDPLGPPLSDAVERQLGLRLEAVKAPLEVLVIDSVQRPSEN